MKLIESIPPFLSRNSTPLQLLRYPNFITCATEASTHMIRVGYRPLRPFSRHRYAIRLYSDAAKDLIITDQFSTLRSEYNLPRYPIVLCHGFSGFDKLVFPKLSDALTMKQITAGSQSEKGVQEAASSPLLLLDYWMGIKEALEKIGSTVLIAKVPAFGTIKERAQSLNDFIEVQCKVLRKQESKASIYDTGSKDGRTFKSTHERIKVNLVAHSMGGLDSRYLISRLPHKLFQVVSLTTVSTPHHGSECADFVVDIVNKLPALKPLCPRSIPELTTSHMKQFNKEVPDDPNVHYLSYGATFDPHWFNVFKITSDIMKLKNSSGDAKNDGLVSVESAKWGHYLGTLDQVDHLDLINWTNKARTMVDKAMFAHDPKFNAIALYLDVADNLYKHGF